jgi:signal transduction histidine kinase
MSDSDAGLRHSPQAPGTGPAWPAEVGAAAEDRARRLLHELQVHQEELAQQNESLQETQDELAHSLQRYVDLYETAPVGLLTLDRQAEVLEANRCSRDLLGMEALVGSKLLDHLAPESQSLLWRAIAMPASASPGASLVLLTADRQRSFNAEISVSKADGDKLSMVLTDISARLRAEAKLERTRGILELTNQAARIGHWSFELEQQRWTWSSVAHEILPIPADQAGDFEANLAFIKAGESRERIRVAFAAALTRGESFDIDLQILSPDGGERWVRVFGRVDSVQGRVRRLYGTLQDIDDRVQAERTRLDRIELASRSKSVFLASMSHELRTPLSAVLGFSELLARDEAVQASVVATRQLGHIADAGKHLLAMIDKVLDLARVEAGELNLVREVVAVGPLLAECLTLIAPLAAGRQVSLACRDAGEEFCVFADRTRLRQVLINLLSNAVKYNREGGSIAVDMVCREQELSVAISDTGMGLLPEQLAELFQPFNRLGAECSQTEGTGLGLVISRQLVEAMGGQIVARSLVGQGSVFTVCLPIAEGLAMPVLDQVLAVESTGGGAAVLQLRVLYVEDNRLLAEMMRQFFRRIDGAQLEVATDGEAGLAAARALRPDLLLLDINLPRLNGLELLAQLRADPELASIPCVAVSANAMDTEVARALAAGFFDYIIKPFPFDRIAQLVAKLRA